MIPPYRRLCFSFHAIAILVAAASASVVSGQGSGNIDTEARTDQAQDMGTAQGGPNEFTIGHASSSGGAAAWASASTASGSFSVTGHVRSRSGPGIGQEGLGAASVFLERQVCLVPTDPSLLGTTADVVFGSSGAAVGVDAWIVNDPSSAALVFAEVAYGYYINGSNVLAGGYDVQKTIRVENGVVTESSDYAMVLSPGNPIPTVTLGVPFTIKVRASFVASSSAYAIYNGTWHQSASGAAAFGSIGLGFPTVQDTSGNPITAYTWIDCGGSGLPIDPNYPLAYPFFVAPRHGPNSGVTGVVLTGIDFEGTTEVLFDGIAVPFTVVNDSQITLDLPPTSTTGWVDVSVTNSLGTHIVPDGFDYFVQPAVVGTPCGAAYMEWSGSPTLGQQYTVTTQNLGADSQVLLVDWSNQFTRTRIQRIGGSPSPCRVLLQPDLAIPLGINPSYTFEIPSNLSLVGVHLRTQARILRPGPIAFTDMLDATVGE